MQYRLRTLLIVPALGPIVVWMIYHAVQLIPIISREGGMPDRSAPFK
ncbi:MAG TPA: hypothetical protein VFV87_19995 [Pirellulaceae bacterium]|nr:hypothetical protein [Pirellulaceae bacterium]